MRCVFTLTDGNPEYLQNRGKKSLEFCAGTYLRTEIANAFDYYGVKDRYTLFVDVDTMILNEIDLDDVETSYFAASPDWDISDWSSVGTGVMLINIERMKRDYPKLVQHLIKHNFDFAFDGNGPCSQGAWNTFFRGKWDRLDPLYDWKPWWGFNPEAKVVHFSGPKPKEIPRLLVDQTNKKGKSESEEIKRFVVNCNREAFLRYSSMWEEYRKISESKDFE
ncbi:MAG: hypothetical protein WDZ85_03435 [Candidatus Paceibacterota bacterium]